MTRFKFLKTIVSLFVMTAVVNSIAAQTPIIRATKTVPLTATSNGRRAATLSTGIDVVMRVNTTGLDVNPSSDPVSMFQFRVSELKNLPPSPPFNIPNCQKTEVSPTYYQVETSTRQVQPNGNQVVYVFRIKGLQKGKLYHFQIIPVHQSVKPKAGYELLQQHVTDCASTAVGQTFEYSIHGTVPPR